MRCSPRSAFTMSSTRARAAIAATGFKALEQLELRAMWSVAAPSSAALKAFKKRLPKVKVDVGE